MRLITLIFLLICCNLWSQTFEADDVKQTRYRFSHLGIADGLSTGTVNCFYKDSEGFIWIGTTSGLNRFNGYSIETFNPSLTDSLAIQSKDFKKIIEGPLGNLWTQTAMGINIFDPRTEEFSSDYFSLLRELGLPEREVKEIFRDSKGNFWFIQENAGITKYSAEKKEVVQLLSSSKNGAISTDNISWFSEDSHGDYWIIHSNGIFEKLDKKTLRVVSRHKELRSAFSGDHHNYRFVIDDDNNLWIHLFGDHGVFYFEVSKSTLRNFKRNSSGLSLSSDLIADMVKDQSGNIWVATDHGGITVINTKELSANFILPNSELDNSLSHNSLTSLYCDYDGIVWVGTYKNGVDYYNKNIFRFPHYENLFSDPKSLPFNDINVFAEDNKGIIWMGTNGGGLISFNRRNGKYKQYLHDPNDPASISSDIVVSLVFDRNGLLWIGTYRGGLNSFDGKRFKHYKKDSSSPESLGGNSVWELFEDSSGRLWVGTLDGGLDVYDPAKEAFHHSTQYEGQYPLHGNYISAITEDKEGNMWIGGVNGIDLFHPETGETRYFGFDPNDPASLSSNYILAIFRDSEDNIWVGTDEGLDLFNPNDNSFYHYTIADGLAGSKILSIIEDDQQDLWLTSSYGLTQFEKGNAQAKDGKIVPRFRNYDDKDGLQGKQFNENAIYKTRNGELLVGGTNGFNLFNPAIFSFNNKPPKIVFTSLEIYNEKVRPNQEIKGRVILSKPINETSKIALKQNENLFALEFAALDYFQPSKNRYKYKLEGFDQNWQEASSANRRVTYTNLDPGHYEFKVQASNNDQVWNTTGNSLLIQVLPPFYKTPLAYFLYLLLIILVLHLARRNLIRKQRKNFRIEQEKREADHLHKMNQMKIRFFTNISHEFKTPLSMILDPLEKLKSREYNKEAKEQLEMINKNAKRLFGLINEILDLGNIQNTPLLSTHQGNIIEFIEQTVDSFRPLSESKQITLNFVSKEEEFHTSFDMGKLEKILFNLLSNAFKFTPKNGNICVQTKVLTNSSSVVDKKMLQIQIKDTGIGISSNDQSRIFDRFFKVDPPENTNNPGSGIGLSLVKEYVDLYKGTISVQSSPGKGTTFVLHIPLEDMQAPALGPNKSPDGQISSGDPGKATKEKGPLLGRDSRPSILLIEDDQDFLNYLTTNLKEDFHIFVAANGEIGWKKALGVQPDLIICDWMMPVMNGIELCQKLRKDSRTNHIPFILLTGNANEKNTKIALKTGVNDYVVKPVNFEVLTSRIENLIYQRKSFQQAYSKKINVETKPINIESEDDAFMRKVLKVVDRNIGNPEFSVESLASELGVSRTFLYNKMVSRLEKSPIELIRDTRLDRGKELLLKSQLTISEVAFEVGFNNPKYFTKNFKKKFQMLPSEYRSKVA